MEIEALEMASAADRVFAVALLLETRLRRLANYWIGCIILHKRRTIMWPPRSLSSFLLAMDPSDVLLRAK